MQNFTPWNGLAGGLLIGLSATLFLIATGRISGISGIAENILRLRSRDFTWSLAYLIALPIGALFVAAVAPQLVPVVKASGSTLLIVVAGLLVGYGSRLGSGCTSGHGVCGLPRFSLRSMAATGIFMAVAAATVFVSRHLV